MATMKKSEVTIEKALDGFIRRLKADGKSDKTIAIYKSSLTKTGKLIGLEKKVVKLTAGNIGKLFKSDDFSKKKNGEPKDEKTILQDKRALRLMLEWAKDKKIIKTIPFPKAEMPKAAAA